MIRDTDRRSTAARQVDDADALRTARARIARPYIGTWRPLILLSTLAITLALTVAFPDGARGRVVIVVAAMTATSVIAALAQLRGVDTMLLTRIVTLLDVPFIALWAVQTSAVGEALAALIGPILIAALLCGPRSTLQVGAASLAVTSTIWWGHERWSTPQVVPDVLWILTIATIVAWLLSREAEAAVHASSRSMRQLTLELTELEVLRRRLVADVSHELRTPLTAVNGFLDTVLRDDLSIDAPSRRELLLEARRGGARLELLITDLLDVERTVSGLTPLVLHHRPIGPLIDDAVRSTPHPPERSIRTTFASASLRSAMVHVDEVRIIQALGSIVENAVRHGRGHTDVSCSEQGSSLRIDVSDDGDGLPAGGEIHAFEPFATFGDHHGSAGLGLAIARSIVIAHGGTLEYVPRDADHRHAFRLILPRAPGLTPAEAAARR